MTLQTKIYIIGPAGSGKSFLAKKLSSNFEAELQNNKKLCLPILDLDDIFWKTKYTEEHPPTKKQELLQKFIKTNPNNWIIEGAPQEFLKPVSKHKPKIIWLNPSTSTLLYRVTKRFLFEKLKKTEVNLPTKQALPLPNNKNNPKTLPAQQPKETLKSLSKIIRGIISYKLKNKLYHQHKDTSSDSCNLSQSKKAPT